MDARTSTAPWIILVYGVVAVLLSGTVLVQVLQLEDPESWRVASATAGFVIFAMLFGLAWRARHRAESASGQAAEAS